MDIATSGLQYRVPYNKTSVAHVGRGLLERTLNEAVDSALPVSRFALAGHQEQWGASSAPLFTRLCIACAGGAQRQTCFGFVVAEIASKKKEKSGESSLIVGCGFHFNGGSVRWNCLVVGSEWWGI